MAVVAALRVAPVKGLATISRDSVHLDDLGVAEDRRVLLLAQDGSVITLRRHPHLVQITPDLNLERGTLAVTLPDGAVATTPLDDAGDHAQAELYGKQRPGRLLPGEVAEALSSAAGEAVRVLVAERTGVGWDEGPVSILGRASAAAVGGGRDRARYRMLVELDGTDPYEEDTWVGKHVKLGEALVQVTHPLERCVIITQSPATGDKDWEGLHALAAERGPDRLCLGVIAGVVTPGVVRIGAPVRVLP